MSFNTVFGHETIIKSLCVAISQDRISNAYVFEGIKGVGKRLCAHIFSMALVCQKNTPPCGECPLCVQANSRTLPDIIRVTKDADKTQIGVDNVRNQIIAEAFIKPAFAKRKIFIIENGDELSTEAQNALLKVLEEPPSYVTFIICTTSKEKLLSTVLSRSQVVSFFPLASDTVEKYIKENYPDEPSADVIARLSRGSIGEAIAILSDEQKKERIKKALSLFINLKKNSLSIREMVDFLTAEKENTEELLDYFSAFLRDCVMYKTDAFSGIIFQNHIRDIKDFSDDISKKKLLLAFDKLSELKIRLKQNLNFNATVTETVMRIWEELHD